MKRNLFEELSEGLDALEKEREGQITLRTHQLRQQPEPTDSSGAGKKGTIKRAGQHLESRGSPNEEPE